jgi:hypothetical protein
MYLRTVHKGSTTGMPTYEFVKASLEPKDLNLAGEVTFITGGTRGHKIH